MGCPPSRASTQPTSAARLQAAPTTDRGRSSSTPDRPPEPGGNLTGVTTLNTELAPKRRRNTIGRGNHGHLAANQICRHYRQSIVMPLSPGGSRQARCVLQHSQFHSDPGERRRPRAHIPDPALEKPDHRYRRLLRARRQRTRPRAAEQRDELATLHSITSSARCWRNQGTSRPSAFAVLRLIVRVSLTGPW